MASFQSSLVNIDYYINQDFYEAHCTNKDKPEMECHGKCQVKSNSEKENGIMQVAKFCYEFNFVPQTEIEFHKDLENPNWKTANGFSNVIDPLLKGTTRKIPHPPEI
jgi:hypothetical protein